MKQELGSSYLEGLQQHCIIVKTLFPYCIIQDSKTLLYRGIKIIKDGIHIVISEGGESGSKDIVENDFKQLGIIR